MKRIQTISIKKNCNKTYKCRRAITMYMQTGIVAIKLYLTEYEQKNKNYSVVEINNVVVVSVANIFTEQKILAMKY